MEHRALQIVESDPSSNLIIFNEDILRRILTADEIKNRFVSVVSITGAARQGKSFLLNFFLRYLRIRYLEKRDVTQWLNPEDGPLRGFSWVPGSRRHTTGIMMWSEIFLTTLDSGEEVAIILLDTQGAFDNQSSMNDCAKIFALSTLISSTQIYNVLRGIKQYDLGHLQCFGGYSRLLMDSGAPFQNLYFLVRDWAYAYDHPYGKEGGLAFLEETFSSEEPEVKEQVDNIKDLFEGINCFLMPYPGREVDTSKDFNGDLNVIDPDFKQHIQDLAVLLLSPENLVLKTINGAKVRAKELMVYIKEYSNILRDGALPPVETIFQASIEAQYGVASKKALKFFKINMDTDVKRNSHGWTEEELYHIFFKNVKKAVNHFTESKKIYNEAVFDKYLMQLKTDMDNEYKPYRKMNENNKVRYEARMRSIEEERKRRKAEEAERRSLQSLGGSSQPGGSRQAQMSGGEIAAIAVGVVGGVAALAFGASKLFSSSSRNNNN